MTKAMHVTVMGLMAGMMVSVTAQAQQEAEEQGQPVRFSISTIGSMTDNRDSTDVNEQDNTDIYVRPRIDVVHEGAGSQLDFYYEPAYRYRSDPGDTQDESTLQHDAGVKALRSLSPRTRVRLFDHFVISDDPAIEEQGATLRGDLSYTLNILQAGLNYDMLENANLDVMARNRIRRYDEDDVARLSDEDSTLLQGQLRHQLSPRLRSVLTGKYALYSYEEVNEIKRDFDSVTGAVGLENAFTPNISGTVSVGWQNRQYDDDGLDSEGLPYVQASLRGNTGADLEIGATVGHGVRDADVYPFASQEYSELRGHADFSFTPKLSLRGMGTYRISTYDDEHLPSGAETEELLTEEEGEETTLVADVRLSYAVQHNVTVYIGHRFEDIDSDVGQSYTKNTSRVGGALSF